MLNITFATGNEGKLAEARAILGSGVEIKGTDFEVPEIQSLDPTVVATQKARDYHTLIRGPLVVEDVALTFAALGGQLPGPYIDAFAKALGNNGIVDLLRGQDNRKAVAQTTLAYTPDGQAVEIFIGRIAGTIALKERGKNGFGWDPIFIPDEQPRTFAEMTLDQKNQYSMRAMAFLKFKKWLESEAGKLLK